MIRLDTSALVELVVREAESATLLAWLRSRSDVPLVTGAQGRVELIRVAVRADDPLDGLDTVRLSDAVMARRSGSGLPACGRSTPSISPVRSRWDRSW